MKNAGLYVRVSTEQLVKEGYSIQAQKENLINFAKEQNWNVFDIYSDEGISGKNVKDRPNVKRLINDIMQKKIDVVVLYKFDRLTRDSKDTEEFIELIRKYEIGIYTISGGVIDVSSATGRFSLRVTGAVAQLEREQTIERVKVAFKQKVKEGYTLASFTTCYGYDREKYKKEQTINKKEANVVKRIFKLYLNGKTFTEICNILNNEKIKTKKTGKKIKKRGTNEFYIINSIWMPKTIKTILTNPTYIGKVRYHIGKKDELILDGKHKPIITEKDWQQVQDKILKIKKIHRTNLPKDDVYYCGTLICGICGERLTTNRTKRKNKNGITVSFNGYRCLNKEKKICNCLGMSHKKVENAFLEYLDKIDDLTEINNIKISTNDSLKELCNLKKILVSIAMKKKQIMNLFMNNNINYEQFKYMSNELEEKDNYFINEKRKLEKINISKNNIDFNVIPKSIKEHWLMLSNTEKLQFLTEFIEKITIINIDNDKKNGKPKILDVKFYD